MTPKRLPTADRLSVESKEHCVNIGERINLFEKQFAVFIAEMAGDLADADLKADELIKLTIDRTVLPGRHQTLAISDVEIAKKG